mmetsp:Transcript_92382/g.265739  ORF Transcript_92382/g.265739 Transcript_92382/m.265739 type:complete len:298 (+) Transcript_92382:177-1070(+)
MNAKLNKSLPEAFVDTNGQYVKDTQIAPNAISGRAAKSLPTKLKTTCAGELIAASRAAIRRSSPPKIRCAGTDWMAQRSAQSRANFKKIRTPKVGIANENKQMTPIVSAWFTRMVGHNCLQVTSKARAMCNQTCSAQCMSSMRSSASLASRAYRAGEVGNVAPSFNARASVQPARRRAGASSPSDDGDDFALSLATPPLALKICCSACCPVSSSRVPAKLRHKAPSILPNSCVCHGSWLSSSSISGVGMSTARRHCGGFFHTPSTSMALAESNTVASMKTSAGFWLFGKSTRGTAKK